MVSEAAAAEGNSRPQAGGGRCLQRGPERKPNSTFSFGQHSFTKRKSRNINM